ncbi:MAG: hypothetical protein EOP06_32575 [Proteobacteria bacterium]|nr:MAG: hypothetical protein EOP06_32575 [Pseudomonadota bacterium]
MKHILFLSTLIVGLASAYPAHAAGPTLTYQGRLLTASGTPISGQVNFRIKILSPGSEQCVLWQETQTETLDSGVFALSVNGSLSTRTDGGTHAFADVFSTGKASRLRENVPPVMPVTRRRLLQTSD